MSDTEKHQPARVLGWLFVIMLGFGCTASAGQLAGQGVGVIEGRLTDESQAVLPGVSVTRRAPRCRGNGWS